VSPCQAVPALCKLQLATELFRPPGTLVLKAFCFIRDVFYLFIYHRLRSTVVTMTSKINGKTGT